MDRLTHAGLFSGIGGFSLAAEWMGWQNVFEVELDPFCRQVLHKNFPHSQLFEDVCAFDGLPFRGRIDVLSGGFPCQPFSEAGLRRGHEDPRALWPQMLRIIRECRPRFVVAENVFGLLTLQQGVVFESVCASLEAEGYQVIPLLLPACGVGAPHKRDRIWIVAHAASEPGRGRAAHGELAKPQTSSRGGAKPRTSADDARHSASLVLPQPPQFEMREPALCGRNDGLPPELVLAPDWKQQLKAYGNAIVPQVAYQIFQAIAATADE